MLTPSRHPGTAVGVKSVPREWVLLTGMLAVWLMQMILGPVEAPDSLGYINGSPIRPPLYPAVVQSCLWVSAQYGLHLVVALQTAWGLWSTWYFTTCLLAGPPRSPAHWFSWLAVLVPIVAYSTRILPETFAYGGYLIVLGVLQQFVRQPSMKHGLLLAFGACLTQALRPAYLFFWPIPFFAWVIVSRQGLRSWPKFVLGVSMTLSMMLGSLGLQRAIKHVQGISSVSGLGHQLLNVQLYLVDPQSFGASSPSDEVETFAHHIGQHLRKRPKLQTFTQQSRSNPHLFEPYFQAMSRLTLHAYADMQGLSSIRHIDLVAFDILARKLALRMIAHHPLRFLRHVAKELFRAQRYFAVLVLLLWAYWGVQAFQSQQAVHIYAWLVVTSGVGNYALALMVEPLITRYVYPTDASIIAVLFALKDAKSSKQRLIQPQGDSL